MEGGGFKSLSRECRGVAPRGTVFFCTAQTRIGQNALVFNALCSIPTQQSSP